MDAQQRRAALETEFERLKERADFLDRTLQGHPDTWLGIQAMIPDGSEVVIDKAIGEARQNALAMSSILKTLDGTKAEAAPAPAEVDPLKKIEDELAARRAEKSG
jgi:hypothetical protein